MEKFHINRLEKLYDFLGTIKPKKFFFGAWACGAEPYEKPDLNVCGSTACALGWAASMPEFRKRGLKMHWNEEDEEAYPIFTDNHGYTHIADNAGAQFFGLSWREADMLFIPNSDENRSRDMPLKDYRKMLRKFIDGKKRELNIK